MSQVSTIDPNTGKVTATSVFELRLKEIGGKKQYKKVELRTPKVEDLGELRAVGMFFSAKPGEGMQGVTNMTDPEIRSYAQSMIDKHGDYDIMVNSCRNFASELFEHVCNVQGSARAKVLQRLLEGNKVLSGGSSKNIFGGLAVLGGLMVVAGVYEHHRNKK